MFEKKKRELLVETLDDSESLFVILWIFNCMITGSVHIFIFINLVKEVVSAFQLGIVFHVI